MSTISSNHMPTNDDDLIDLSAVLQQLWQKKWFIMAFTAIFLVAGVFYALSKPPLYQSSVLVQISSKNDNILGSLGGGIGALVGGKMTENPESRQIALIQSKYILDPVIESLHLDVRQQRYQGFIQYYFVPYKESHLQLPIFDVPRPLLDKRLMLSIDNAKHFILSDADGALLLKGTTNALVSAENDTIRLKIEESLSLKPSTYALIKRPKSEVVKQLISKLVIKDLGGRESTGVLSISVIDKNPHQIVDILNMIAKTVKVKDAKKKSREASKTLAFLYQQLPLTKLSLEKSEAALNQYRATSGKIDIKIQSKALLMQLSDVDNQLSALRIKKVDLLQQFTNAHPTMIAFNLQVEALKKEKSQLEHQLKTLPASDQKAVSLMRDVKVKNELYLLLLNKIQELRVIKASTVSDVTILSFATMPDTSLPSKSTFIVLAGMLLGFMLSCLSILGRQLLYTKVDDPHWSERHLSIVNVAVIPYCKEQGIFVQKAKKQQTTESPLLAQRAPRNLSIESLRSLRTSLQVTLSCASNNIVSILGITPGVGKSFVSSNLAYLLAAAGKRVLLIDGDLRRGILHKTFNVEPMPGLSDILNHKTTAEELLLPVHANLTFLPRGAYATDPSELLTSDHFKQLIASFSQQFDIVLIDTPPVLLVTDAVVIGALSATNYLVLGAKTHQPDDIQVAVKRLSNGHVQVHGTIFNAFHAQASSQQQQYNAYYDEAEH